MGVGKLIGGNSQVAERAAGVQIFHLGHRHDVARARVIDAARFAGLDFQQRPQLDRLAGGRGVHHVRPS